MITSFVRILWRRPRLWAEAIRAAWAMSRRGWWRTPPFLPVPDTAYVDWRVTTAYGSDKTVIAGEDVVAYLEWRRAERRAR